MFNYSAGHAGTYNSSELYQPLSEWNNENIDFYISEKKGVNLHKPEDKASAKWNDWVIVRALEDLHYGDDLVITKGTSVRIPAFYLHYMVMNAVKRYTASVTREAFDFVMIGSGVGGVLGGATELTFAIAVADIVVGSADLVISSTEQDIINWLGAEKGKEVLSLWTDVTAIYGAGVTVRAVTPWLYSKSLLLHNHFQSIDWTNVPGTVNPSTVRSFKLYKVKLEKIFGGEGNGLLESARQFVRNNYGQHFLNQITLKYGKENTGALSVLVKRFGNEGADLLKQGKSLDEIASALVKDRKLYRHIGSEAGYLENLKTTGKIPAGYTTYFSADKFDDPVEAISKMQLNSEWTDAVWLAEFDGAQLLGKVEIPKAKWNEASYLEVLTKSFPKWGEGGATQFITKSEINISKLLNLKTGDFIDFSLVNELKNAGVKFNQADIKWVFKNSDGKILFLEKGTTSAGFEHVMSHKNDFINKGIAESDISDFIMQALKENKIVAYQGTVTSRPIYELTYKGTKQRVAIAIDSNGFVVGANPTSL